MRGARYGFPGWVEQTQTKGGKTKTVYIERRDEAGAKAREYLSVAKTAPGAGRPAAGAGGDGPLRRRGRRRPVGAVVLHLPVPRGLPWTDEIVDLIDELAAERLPDHLTAQSGPSAPSSASRRPNS